ncbi:PadR family transcriptional regulator [Aestuariivirga sp.]|uniref:PadR family transcriptional regulator n=1 Tax=Aestuariivirga sp. TaxID=2650926 RepID=UPI0025B7DBFE|nr:PadR family transcriptional regulator [Aestuariivirga sp.]MCA3556127.1 PadR family transcriptional regulator [Aestuariivirga sp.]
MNVRTLCLGVLSSGEASGYEIKKEIEEGMFSHFIDASFGSIYPALTQLAGEGLVTVRAEEQSGKPDKKVYAITPKGKDALARSISVVPGRDKYKSEFLFQMLLQEYIAPAAMLAAIDKHLADLRADLARIDECECAEQPHAGARFVAGYGRAVLTAAVNVLIEKKAELLRRMAPLAAE